jgi:hypothetical protein
MRAPRQEETTSPEQRGQIDEVVPGLVEVEVAIPYLSPAVR